MKKIIFAIIATLIISVIFTGCSTSENKIQSDTLDIVCTVFPQYDWIKNITKNAENVNVSLLCNNGTDMHSFQPSAKDILSINTSDIVVATGGISDKWVLDTTHSNQTSVKVSLMELLGENTVKEHTHANDDLQEHEHHDSLHETDDEHIWLSVSNAIHLTWELCDVLCRADAENAALYRANTDNYIKELTSLHNEYKKCVEMSENKTIVVADRFPFVYMTEEYGICAYAAFPGCSADTNASFDTIIDLASKVDNYHLSCVAVTESSDLKTARAIIENTRLKNADIVILDSMQSITEKDIENGTTYVSVMRENLVSLGKLLN